MRLSTSLFALILTLAPLAGVRAIDQGFQFGHKPAPNLFGRDVDRRIEIARDIARETIRVREEGLRLAELERRQGELESRRHEIGRDFAALERELGRMHGERAALAADLRDRRGELAEIERRRRRAPHGRVLSLRREIERLECDLVALDARIESRRCEREELCRRRDDLDARLAGLCRDIEAQRCVIAESHERLARLRAALFVGDRRDDDRRGDRRDDDRHGDRRDDDRRGDRSGRRGR
ncbi:MAG: hypothetical protein R3F20_17395 [Planctomycetota bacterium]